MKQAFITSILILVSIFSMGQITVGDKFVGSRPSSLDDDVARQIKKSKLLFVAPEYIDKDSMKTVLQDVWTFNDVEVLDYKTFNKFEYVDGDYAICEFYTLRVEQDMRYSAGSFMRVRSFFNFYIFDSESINEKISKIKSSKKDLDVKKLEKIFDNATSRFARILLHDNTTYTQAVGAASNDDIQAAFGTIFTEPYFENFNYGMFKNHLQVIVSDIKKDQSRIYFEEIESSQLSKLRKQPLFIPEYVTKKYAALEGVEEDDKDFFKDLMSKYPYKYEVLPSKEISDKILKGEEFYYVRYTRYVAERFLEVVNSKTGEIVFNLYAAGALNYNLKTKHFKQLAKNIK